MNSRNGKTQTLTQTIETKEMQETPSLNYSRVEAFQQDEASRQVSLEEDDA